MSAPPFPELRTPRFLLRRIVPADRPTVYAGLSDPRVIVNYGISYATLEATQRQMDWFEALHAEGTGIWWGICQPDRPEFLLGACGLNDLVREHRRAELGYWLLPEHWGLGIARECVGAILDHAYTVLGLHRIGADVDLENHRSSSLLEALGFSYEGTSRGYELKNGVFLDLKHYGRLASDSVPGIYR